MASGKQEVSVVCRSNSTENSKSVEDNSYGIYKYYVWFLAVFGSFHWKGCAGEKLSWFQKLAVLFSGFMLVICLCNLGKYTYICLFFKGEQLGWNYLSVDKIMTSSWAFAVFCNSLIIFLSCWRVKGGLHELLKCIMDYKNDNCFSQMEKFERKSKRTVLWAFLLSCVWMVFVQGGVLYTYFGDGELGNLAGELTWSFIKDNTALVYLEILDLALVTPTAVPFIGLTIFFMTLCLTISNEFRKVTSRMANDIDTSRNVSEIKKFHSQYQQLAYIVTLLDRIFRHFMAINLLMAVVIICFGSYQLIYDKRGLTNAIPLLYWMVIYFIILLILLSSSAYLQKMVSRNYKHICKL